MPPDFIRTHLRAIGWSLASGTTTVAIIVWGNGNHWQLADLSTYQWFPLFGLVAFSLFWSQYVMLALAQYAKVKKLKRFFKVTGRVGLGALVLHPSLLVYQLWRDGFGLPPESYVRHFVAPGLGWVALLGTFSWFIFLIYYLQRFLKNFWWWRWFKYVTQVAILAVFYHGLRLGEQLQSGWFHYLWLVYGIVLVLALLYLNRDPLAKALARLKNQAIKEDRRV